MLFLTVPQRPGHRAFPKPLTHLHPPAFQNLEMNLKGKLGWACFTPCGKTVTLGGMVQPGEPGGRKSMSCLTWLRPDSLRGQSHLLWAQWEKEMRCVVWKRRKMQRPLLPMAAPSSVSTAWGFSGEPGGRIFMGISSGSSV